MHIVELRAENVKRIKAVAIRPGGDPLVVVGGQNGQGKSSVLDSIMYALAGGKSLPERPVRDGQSEAEIILDLGEIVVTRFFGDDGKTSVKVQSKDGASFSSPQTMLDGLIGKLSFDPLAFTRLDAKKQVEQLKQVVGLDFTEIDGKRLTKYEQRTLAGAEVKRIKAQIQGMPTPAITTSESVNVADLLSTLRAAEAMETQKERLARNVDTAKMALTNAESALRKAQADRDAAVDALAEAEAGLRGYCPPADSSDTIRAQLAGAEQHNESVRQAKALKAASESLVEAERKFHLLDIEINQIDADKKAKLEAAKFPVEGLSFTDGGLTFNGKPFAQASQAEQLKVAVAMGAALNSKARIILMRDGSLLDDSSLADLRRIAETHDMQVWVERVGKGKEVTVLIEDGSVVPMEAIV